MTVAFSNDLTQGELGVDVEAAKIDIGATANMMADVVVRLILNDLDVSNHDNKNGKGKEPFTG